MGIPWSAKHVLNQEQMMLVVEDGHKQAFNPNPGDVTKTLILQWFWRFTSNCPMYYKDTYYISKYDVYTILEWSSHHNNNHT